ncbi:MAG: proton-conducting transporter membrane subunit, partial [bacterium]
AGVVTYITGTRRISQLGGLVRKLPTIAFVFTVGVFAVGGMPPFACFFSKFYIVLGAVSLHNWLGISSAVFVVLESTVSLTWLIIITHRIFLGEEKTSLGETTPVPLYINILIVLLALATVIAPQLGLKIVRLFEVIR